MEQLHWFENWFDTKYYHLLYKNRDLYEAEYFIGNILRALNLPRGSRIWDNACGNGRHIAVFAKMGYECIGTDLSQNNILQANALFGKQAQFYKHDMRRVFYLNYFDLAVNLFTSIGYFDNVYENISVIKNMSAAIKRDGYIIIDFFNPEFLRFNLVPFEKKEIEGVVFEITRVLQNDLVVKNIHVKTDDKNLIFQERVRLLDFKFFKYAFEKSGLVLRNLYGDYDLNPLTQNAPRMIFICQKKG